MTGPRTVEPELLDLLPADAPGALRSRRDIRRLNALMLHSRIMARLIERHMRGGRLRRLVDLGGGDGTFMAAVARILARRWADVTLVLVDRHDVVARDTHDALAALGWRMEVAASDVFDYLARPAAAADVVTANLFLHHFEEAGLRRLLAGSARLAPLFVACEPRRSRLARLASGMVCALGCNHVTRHDARASVRAGFAVGELSRLWPEGRNWRLHDAAIGPFTHCFTAAAVGQKGEIGK